MDQGFPVIGSLWRRACKIAAPVVKCVPVISLTTSSGKLTRNNWVLFSLVTVSSLRVSQTKEGAKQKFEVLTRHPKTHNWFEQKVSPTDDEKFGHPNPLDEVVLIYLLDAFRLKKRKTIEFKLADLLSAVGWPVWQWYGWRAVESLHRWFGLRLTFERGAFDETTSAWEPATIPALGHVVTPDLPADLCLLDKPVPDGSMPSKLPGISLQSDCCMEWSEPVLATLEQSELDFRLSDYIRFQNAAARRTYLLTNHHLSGRGSVSFDLRDFAEKNVRFTSGYSNSLLKNKLGRALDDLESQKYIEKANRYARFPSHNGAPTIHFSRGSMVKLKPQGRLDVDPFEATDMLPPPAIPKRIEETTISPEMLELCQNFWQRLSPAARQAEEAVALSLASEKEKELLAKGDPYSNQIILGELMRLHALSVMGLPLNQLAKRL